ncbi:hypothetical protein E1263_08070 [Kribbella antibiotica]|uniref:Uncharacterized protein n=1 Tax=Kribbella antibiotica TaxID=190195 RepID=A0A4R4ZT68_9ACTN|nr:hypothetical protein [Kribbella antibiotica]TDD61304.1 hypothetical protein E1263_08070 [Kribbella antibiotica]
MNALDLVRSLDPTADADPAAQVAPETRAELLRDITAEAAPIPLKSARSVRRRLVPVLAAAAAVAAITALVVHVPGDNDRPQALSFSTQGEVMKVRVVDPLADSKRFNKEFKAKGLDIKLVLEPASPSVVGKEVAMAASAGAAAGRITTVMYPAGCEERGTLPCVPEFTIPLDFQGEVSLIIGRAAEPGETYGTSGFIDGRGEALAGVKYANKTVGDVLKILGERGFTAEYRVETPGYSEPRDEVPTNWFVRDGVPASDHHVILFVSPDQR